jgi:hypothetical protein
MGKLETTREKLTGPYIRVLISHRICSHTDRTLHRRKEASEEVDNSHLLSTNIFRVNGLSQVKIMQNAHDEISIHVG